MWFQKKINDKKKIEPNDSAIIIIIKKQQEQAVPKQGNVSTLQTIK